jgi:YVTN family beta-propeller protein
MGKKMLLALDSALQTETSRLNAETQAKKDGRSYYSYTEYSVAAPRGTITVHPDGKIIYALNSQTSDVTAIDAVTGQVLKKIAAGGFAVRFIPAASVALVVSSTTVAAVDLTSHEKVADIVTGSKAAFNSAELSPDAKLAVIHGPGGVLLVNASSGKPVGTMKPFTRVVDVAIDWARPR